MKHPSVAVVILTFNEACNLPAALDSVVGWASQIFVVDSYSTDRTVDIALNYAHQGVEVVQHPFENFSAQWNWALQYLPIDADWTLKLDADERVPQAFKQEFFRTLGPSTQPKTNDVEGVYFRRRFHFLGTPLQFGGIENNFDLRLWRTGSAVFERRSVNEHAMVSGRTLYFESFVEHQDQKPLDHWLAKHNCYASLEAINILEGNLLGEIEPRFWGTPEQRRNWLRWLYYKVPFRAFWYFLYRVVFRLGILDGRAGLQWAWLHATYLYTIDVKVAHARRTGEMPKIPWPKRGTPHAIIQQSPLQQYVDNLQITPQKAAPQQRTTATAQLEPELS